MSPHRVVTLLGMLVVVGCGSASANVTPAMVTAAQKRSPDATADSLEHGRSVFGKRCHACHALPKPKAKSSEEWPKVLDRMAKLAKLSDAEKKDVLDYVLAARDAE